MASIRRTQSPYRDRSPHLNGANPFSVSSPSHKAHLSNGKFSPSPSPPQQSTFTTLFENIFLQKHSRKGHHNPWRRSLYRCLLFFFLGFLFGMAPFGHVVDDDVDDRSHVFPSDADFVRFEKEPEAVKLVELGIERRYKERFDYLPRKEVIVITPTYNRALQAYYLNRLGQVLRLVPPPLLWIVVEMNTASLETADILRETGVLYRHLVCTKNFTDVKDRGVHQRNTALEHIERHKLDGIVYFADDDNIYSLDLFHSLREIRRFGTWPVAMLAQSKSRAVLEGPVCNGSNVIGWNTNEKSKRLRRFHVDMSGFAFNSTILWDPKRWRRPTSNPIRQLDTVKEGFQETTFIEQVVEDESQMEASPFGCSRIMNWHLHLESRGFVYPSGWLLQKNLDVVLPIK